MPTPPPSDDDFRSLTVTLAGRPYPLRVLPDDEEPIRQIAHELNDKLNDFRESYPGRDVQDCLAMLLLIYSVDLYKVKDGSRAAADPDLLRTLRAVDEELGATLAGQQAPPAPLPSPPSAAAATDPFAPNSGFAADADFGPGDDYGRIELSR